MKKIVSAIAALGLLTSAAFANEAVAVTSEGAIVEAIRTVELGTTVEMYGIVDPVQVAIVTEMLELLVGPAPGVIDGYTVSADGMLVVYSQGAILGIFTLQGAPEEFVAVLMGAAVADAVTDEAEAIDANGDGDSY